MPAKLNQEIEYPGCKWKVLSAEDLGPVLKRGDKEIKAKKGRFILVRFQITNLASTEFPGLIGDPKLRDGQGHNYETIKNQNQFGPEVLKPSGEDTYPTGVPKEVYNIYDVPVDAADLKIETRSLAHHRRCTPLGRVRYLAVLRSVAKPCVP